MNMALGRWQKYPLRRRSPCPLDQGKTYLRAGAKFYELRKMVIERLDGT
jgi:hypothetical protein